MNIGLENRRSYHGLFEDLGKMVRGSYHGLFKDLGKETINAHSK